MNAARHDLPSKLRDAAADEVLDAIDLLPPDVRPEDAIAALAELADRIDALRTDWASLRDQARDATLRDIARQARFLVSALRVCTSGVAS